MPRTQIWGRPPQQKLCFLSLHYELSCVHLVDARLPATALPSLHWVGSSQQQCGCLLPPPPLSLLETPLRVKGRLIRWGLFLESGLDGSSIILLCNMLKCSMRGKFLQAK
ncbi:hypothetical protein HETIRDRAFT_322336 [Heterobasidion irregulare TC 32-1]|uniref:Uncharacterized protein n=1 Tax=Heterobasidion irregulare (strain TC 32-1) TaxID=747525 RepID=W4K111_HETIT|nr:uncharacterized protein HETIRDRAFT_322336 [Heterobasidion irregulare TC 32-1]ETW79523.1 hypothetical protein HETIRDRAFT_322336 [Heterobasidion irregulare TC 32-1]